MKGKAFILVYSARLTTRNHHGLMRSFGCSARTSTDAKIELCSDHAKVPLHGRRGVFHGWTIIDLVDVEKVKAIAWTIDPRGYVVGHPRGSKNSITMHRWLMIGVENIEMVDHRDRDRLNNRRMNLRACTSGGNAKNTSLAKNNTSGAKGVSLDVNGRWRARIWKDSKEIRIGTFSTVAEASAAYDRAAAELHGEFASPNSAMASITIRELEGEAA